MSSYGLADSEREGALIEARSIARRLRITADEIEKLADEAEAATDEEGTVGQLADRVSAAALSGHGNLHLPQLVRHCVGWAGARAARP